VRESRKALSREIQTVREIVNRETLGSSTCPGGIRRVWGLVCAGLSVVSAATPRVRDPAPTALYFGPDRSTSVATAYKNGPGTVAIRFTVGGTYSPGCGGTCATEAAERIGASMPGLPCGALVDAGRPWQGVGARARQPG
jgi:hypothetical protein